MTAVKGSKQYKLKVVPYRPLYRAMAWLGASAVILAVLVASYFWGSIHGLELQARAIAERDQLRIDLQAKSREAEEYRQRVANLRLGSEVDRKASEEVRNEVIELKSQIADLEADIAFYRGLMAPSGNKRGLTIGSLDVISTGSAREYDYKLTVQQLTTSHTLLKGYLNFNVVGRKPTPDGQGSEELVLPLRDLTSKVADENIQLRFKYFQNFSGRLKLPEGFEPVRIELLAKSTGKNAVTVEKKFGWLVQEG